MKDKKNISDLLKLNIDFMGFIFYPKSKRYIVPENLQAYISGISSIKKVGVFVNESEKNIIKLNQEYQLDYIQLHGSETPELCTSLKNKGLKIIKAFQVNEAFNFNICDTYTNVCDYFLFDTKSIQYGGSGLQFDWELLKNYKNNKPYFLSGGISISDAENIKKISDKRIAAIDINSKFENEYGLKKIEVIDEFINNTRINY